MTAYKLVIGAFAIIILIFLWIPINDILNGTDGLRETFNSHTTDADIQEKNNIVGQVFNYTMLIFIIVIGIWIIKPDRQTELQYGYT